MSRWTLCSERMPHEGAACLVQLANHDIVVAFRARAWETGFFTSIALRPIKGVPRRKLSRLHSAAARWRLLGQLPERVSPLVAKELASSKSRRSRP